MRLRLVHAPQKRGGLGDRPEPGLRQYRRSDAPEN